MFFFQRFNPVLGVSGLNALAALATTVYSFLFFLALIPSFDNRHANN